MWPSIEIDERRNEKSRHFSHDLATIVIGRFGRIEKVDDNACSLLGYSRSELLQLHGTDLVLPEERPAVAVSIDRMRQGTAEQRQGRLVRKDRSVVDVEVNARRLPQEQLAMKIRRLPGDLR